jgi:hypothetical protein
MVTVERVDFDPFWVARVREVFVSVTVSVASGTIVHRLLVASGFLMEFRGHWMWATADHVVYGKPYGRKGVAELLAEDIDRQVRLHPSTGVSEHGVRLRFERTSTITPRMIAEDCLAMTTAPDERESFLAMKELDIACVELDPECVRNLKACGCKPFSLDEMLPESRPEIEKLWSQDDAQFYVVGIPVGTGDLDEKRDVKILPIDHTGLEFPILRFIPRWNPADCDSVLGVSGGPAILVSGGRPYWFGVQDSQIASPSKVIGLKIGTHTLVYALFEYLHDQGGIKFSYELEEFI